MYQRFATMTEEDLRHSREVVKGVVDRWKAVESVFRLDRSGRQTGEGGETHVNVRRATAALPQFQKCPQEFTTHFTTGRRSTLTSPVAFCTWLKSFSSVSIALQ